MRDLGEGGDCVGRRTASLGGSAISRFVSLCTTRGKFDGVGQRSRLQLLNLVGWVLELLRSNSS